MNSSGLREHPALKLRLRAASGLGTEDAATGMQQSMTQKSDNEVSDLKLGIGFDRPEAQRTTTSSRLPRHGVAHIALDTAKKRNEFLGNFDEADRIQADEVEFDNPTSLQDFANLLVAR